MHVQELCRTNFLMPEHKTIPLKQVIRTINIYDLRLSFTPYLSYQELEDASALDMEIIL